MLLERLKNERIRDSTMDLDSKLSPMLPSNAMWWELWSQLAHNFEVSLSNWFIIILSQTALIIGLYCLLMMTEE